MANESDVEVKFGASLEGLQAGIEETKKTIEGLTEPISGIMSAFNELGEALITALAVEKIVDFTKEMGELGEATERMSKIFGITTEQVGELSYAAALTGTSTDNLVMMMGRFESGLSEAEKGTGRMAAGLRSLGLSAKELEGVNPSQQLREIAEAVSKVADSTAKTAALADLGRGFAQLIPLLDEGGEGFDELAEKARAAGVALSAELTSKLVEMQHGMVGLKEDIQGATISGFTPFIGAVNVAVGGMSSLTSAFTDSVNHGGLMKQMLDILADGFRIVESAVNDLVASLKVLGAVATYAITTTVDKALELGNTLSAVALDLAHLDPSFSHVAAVAHQGAQDATDAWNEMRKAIAAALAENDEAAHKIWKGSPLAAKAGSLLGFHLTDPRTGEAAGVPTGGSDNAFKPQPPMPVEQTKDSGKDALQEEISKLNELIDDYKELAKAKIKSLDDALAHQRVSVVQWLAASEDALADERQDVEATYQAEIAAVTGNADKIAEIHRKMQKEFAAIDLQMQEDTQKAADKVAQEWQNAMAPVLSAWNSQLRELLGGAETWGTAMKKIAADMVINMIESFEKLAVEKAALGLGNLFGQGPGGLISSLFGGAAGNAGLITSNATLTTALATLTAAITAQTAATTTAVAASGAGTAAGAGGLFSGLAGLTHLFGFAEGTDYVLQTGPAILHQGEMVVPAHMNPNNPGNSLNFNGGSGDNSGGGSAAGRTGDVHAHFHVNAVDSGSVRSFFHDHAEHIVSALDKGVRNGSHTGLKAFAR